MQKVFFQDLGLIDYKVCWDYQEKLFNEIVQQKLEQRDFPVSEHRTPNHLLFCEHPHVHTLGRNRDENTLLNNDGERRKIDAAFYKNNRGGDITYHGPGQIVGYPILNLDLFFTDIHKYLRYLEEAVICTLKEYNINAGRINGLTGVWIPAYVPNTSAGGDAESKSPRKICAFGVRCSRWVTMHGFAFNVNTDLSYFGNIVPCGIQDKAVTSLEKELGRKMDMSEVKEKVKTHLGELFGMEFTLPSQQVSF